MMRLVIFGQLIYAVGAALAFLAPFGRPRRPVDWYLAGVNWAVVALIVVLIAATGGVHVPLYVGVLVLGVLDAALTLQLIVFLRSRRRAQPPDEE